VIWLFSLALAADPAADAIPPVEAAVRAELDRAMKELRLPDGDPPYLVLYDVLDGEVVTTFAEFGSTVSVDTDHYRNLRTEVRVGSYERDSSNFSSFGTSGSVVARRLPLEDDIRALRREVWLATDQSYKAAVENLARKQAALRGHTEPLPPDFARVTPVDVPYASTGDVPPVQGAHMRDLAETLSAELRKTPGIEVGQAIARDWQGRRLVLTSEGTRVWRATGYTVVRVEGTVRLADGTEQRDSRSWVVRRPEDLPPESEMLDQVRAMATWLAALPAAPKEEDYLGPVLFEGPAAAEVFSQLVAPEILGTPPELEDGDGALNVPTARLGRRLLPAGWSVVDDATTDKGLGAYASDQEGVAPRRVDLVKDGVVQDVLMSRIPSTDRAASTGHGRSLGNDRLAAMPAVVTVTPPKEVSDRRLRKTALHLAAQTGRDYVLVIRRIEPPVLSGDLDVAFTGEGPLPGLTDPYEAYRLYADGREEPVRALRFLGVDRRLLKDIALAGEGSGPLDTLDGPPGPGRYHVGPTGGVPVTWDVPSILVTEVELTTKSGGEPRVVKVELK
jgi:TldD protein